MTKSTADKSFNDYINELHTLNGHAYYQTPVAERLIDKYGSDRYIQNESLTLAVGEWVKKQFQAGVPAETVARRLDKDFKGVEAELSEQLKRIQANGY